VAGIYTTKELVRAQLLMVNTETVTDSDLDVFINQAGQVIDSRLGRLYATPFATPLAGGPEILEVAATDYAIVRALMKYFNDRRMPSDGKGPWQPYLDDFNTIIEDILAMDAFAGVVPRPDALTGAPLGVLSNGMEDGHIARIEQLLAEASRTEGNPLTPAERDADLAYWTRRRGAPFGLPLW
jgi:hypothetical protein